MPYDCINGIPIMFIHIPKNGGSSIKRYFQMQESCHRSAQDFLYNMNKGIVPIALNEEYCSDENFEKYILWKERLENVFEEAEKKQEHLFPKAFKFSFVRNPWDRLASIYHYHKNDFGGLGAFEFFIGNLRNLQGPIFSSESQTILKLTQTQYISVGGKIKRMYDNSFDLLNIRYASGDDMINAMNYIGRFETMQKDVKNICQILDNGYNGGDRHWMNNRGDFTYHERKSDNSKQSYVKMYKEFDSIYAVFDYYCDDIKNFGYTFSGYPNCEITKECFGRREGNAS